MSSHRSRMIIDVYATKLWSNEHGHWTWQMDFVSYKCFGDCMNISAINRLWKMSEVVNVFESWHDFLCGVQPIIVIMCNGYHFMKCNHILALYIFYLTCYPTTFSTLILKVAFELVLILATNLPPRELRENIIIVLWIFGIEK